MNQDELPRILEEYKSKMNEIILMLNGTASHLELITNHVECLTRSHVNVGSVVLGVSENDLERQLLDCMNSLKSDTNNSHLKIVE